MFLKCRGGKNRLYLNFFLAFFLVFCLVLESHEEKGEVYLKQYEITVML